MAASDSRIRILTFDDTTTGYCTRSEANSIHIQTSKWTTIRSILLLLFHLSLSFFQVLLSKKFTTKILYSFRFSDIRNKCPVHRKLDYTSRNYRLLLQSSRDLIIPAHVSQGPSSREVECSSIARSFQLQTSNSAVTDSATFMVRVSAPSSTLFANRTWLTTGNAPGQRVTS
jgi:hypothetical protein